MKTNKPSKLFTFVLVFFKDHILVALGALVLLFSLFDGIVGRLFKDEANLVATSSLQYMEIGPIALNKYREITAKFEPNEIVKSLETWNVNSGKEKSVIPDKEALEAFRRYADFWLPEEDTIRTYAKTARYKILLENTGTQVAQDIFLISTFSAESAIVERATGAGLGLPKFETIEHDGRRASLGSLFPSEKMEINIWHDSYIVPRVLSITSADGLVDIQQEVTITSRKEVVIALIALGLAILFVNWVFSEFLNLLILFVKKAWKKHNTPDEEIVENSDG